MELASLPINRLTAFAPTKRTARRVWKYLALPLLCCGGFSWGQSVDLSGIAHAAFRVSDIAKTSDFYQRLGFVQAFAFSKEGKTTQAFIKINDRQFIELYPLTARDPRVGFMHICFEASDLVSLNAAYRERGLTPIKVLKAHAGNLLFTMVGPESQNIEYTEYLPGSLHSEDLSKHLGKHRISKRLLSVALKMHDTAMARAFYLDKLAFHPGTNDDRNSLLLAGTSGESIDLKSFDDHALPDMVFQVGHIRRVATDLKSRGFDVQITATGDYIVDPDGTIIEFSSGHS